MAYPMVTSCLKHLGDCLCLCACRDDEPRDLTPLLSRTPASSMGRPRQYGTRRRNVAPTADAIFGQRASPTSSTRGTLGSQETRSTRSTRSQPLDDWRSITQTLDEVSQESPRPKANQDESSESRDSEEEDGEVEPGSNDDSSQDTGNDEAEPESDAEDLDTDSRVADRSAPLQEDSILPNSEHTGIDRTYYGEPAPKHLAILADAYKIDRGSELIVSKWSEVIPPSAIISKIAEASFAEVYRINIKQGTSIIKLLQLNVPNDPASSLIETAIDAIDLVAEIRIMNILAEVPGFVGFKDAHLMKGKWAPALHVAYTEYLGKEIGEEANSYFPDPETFTDESTFLVLELADAGTVLDECEVATIDQVWDLLLGVIMALGRAEVECEFEHRDLHENNICVRQKSHVPAHDPATDGNVKYGFSGYAVTIIDYGLSRAKVKNGDIVFKDLEKDLELFHGEGSGISGMQFDNYRRMRTHLFTGTHTMLPASWHDASSLDLNQGHSWSEHIPYTNVLWIRYILFYLTKTLKKSCTSSSKSKDALKDFEAETKELKHRLDVRTKHKGAFGSAMEVLNYVFEKGWVGNEILEGFGVDSILSDGGE
ncbi:uncharacterized protein L3040_000778 [Drepanopeziza brunnea f. sp. 'multigermtubi']|uniref:uncharacterized protein n=1 Tax=Drepanopeziza brunnea f. sp. 'multigermtubi' TaxID=698441 RepID=UPI002383C0CB|nr:hypothetical protein L3040_000778 [Drepanopeziza brunnea f. sp. 'multigermtubi']